MSTAVLSHPPIIDRVWPTSVRPAVRWAILMAVGSLLLTASAKISVPMWPVPMTMQTCAVLVIGMAFGWRLAAGTVLLYLAEGAVGLPVFTGTPERGIGLLYMAGPTGGYLVGFLVAASVVGWLAERGFDRRLLSGVAALIIGDVLLFACGVAWLSALIGFDKAIAVGVMPFLLGEGLKIVLAAALLRLGWQWFDKRQ